MATFFERYSQSELKAAMSKAIDEAVAVGRDGLRRKYRIERTKNYVAVAAGHHFDGDALVAATAANLEPPVPRTSESTFGTETTPLVLEACAVPWIHADDLTRVPGLDPNIDEPQLLNGEQSRFWWVNQTDNYSTAIKEGSLWAPDRRRDGRPGHKDWTALRLMVPGDVVFHYASQNFRALSVVVSAGVAADRPPGYPVEDYLHGTLVLVEPQILDMEIGLSALKQIFPPGVGPMNRTGNPDRIYVAPVPRSIGEPLADYLSGRSLVSDSTPGLTEPGHMAAIDPPYMIESTDIAAVAARRAEQRFLRQALLERYGNKCALCGRSLPEDLLIAAHIKPRFLSTEEERLDFAGAAMLACSLGCDALFEHGYITVDRRGLVQPNSTNEPDLQQALEGIDGLPCLAFSETTAMNFEFHRKRHELRTGRIQS